MRRVSLSRPISQLTHVSMAMKACERIWLEPYFFSALSQTQADVKHVQHLQEDFLK